MSKRFFINNLDTPIGAEFYRQLVKEDTEEGVHMATYTDNDRLDVPKGFKKILKRYKPKLSRKKMLEECDVYVYDLHHCDAKDIAYVTGIFNNPAQTVDDQKVLILISNVMVWSDTPLKEKKVEEVKIEQDDQDGGGAPVQDIPDDADPDLLNKPSSQQGDRTKTEPQEDLPPPPPVYVPYEEVDYKSRVPKERFRYLKELEDQVLAIQKDNLKVIVVCAGLWYGMGENLFKEHFKCAWLQNPAELPFLGDGLNKIPTIHISDLVRLVIKVAESPCEQPYVFGIDNSPDRSQLALVEGISRGVGSSKVTSVQQTPLIAENLQDYFLLDIDMKPSPLCVGNEENPVDFEWTCQNGISVHCRKVLEEFWKAHELRPMKVMMICPAQRQELRFNETAKSISEHYRIPIITIMDIIEQAQKEYEGEALEDLLEELPKIQEYLSSQQPRPVDETMKLFYHMVKWRLNQNDCTNRGFILDNYPLHSEECEMIFFPNKTKLKRKRKPKKKELPKAVEVVDQVDQPPLDDQTINQDDVDVPPTDAQQPQDDPPAEEPPAEEEIPEEEPVDEEPDQEEGGPKPEPFMPESVIMIKSLDKRNRQGYSANLLEFFTTRNLEVQLLDTRNKDLYEVFENLRLYIERNGRPFNYLQPEKELVQQHNQFYQTVNSNIEKSKNETQSNQAKSQESEYNARVKVAQKQVQYILEKEQELEQIKHFPFRNYLMEFVVPVLNEGLVEVSHMLPDDPIEFLSEYLYRKSFEVDKD